MEGLVGIVNLDGSEVKRFSEVERWSGSFAKPGLDGDCVDCWSDGTLSLAWRANPAVGDLHLLWVDGALACLVGQVTLQDADTRAPDGSAESRFPAIVRDLFSPGGQGPDHSVVRRLTGSFLLLVYMPHARRVHLIADRFSSRTLFYNQDENRLIFATDIRAVLADPATPRHLDRVSVVEFLQCSMIFEDRTLYKCIAMLPPASVLAADSEQVSISRYWSWQYREDYLESEEDYAEALADCFLQATERMLPDSAGLGLMLSGGLDSRMIAACLKAQGKSPIAITFAEFENGEVRLARRVAKELGFKHSFVRRHPEYYRDIMSPAVRSSNGLYSCYHAHMLGFGDPVRGIGIRTLANGWGLDLPLGGSYFPKVEWRLLKRTFPLLKMEPLSTREAIVEILLEELRTPMNGLMVSLATRDFQSLWQDWPGQLLHQLAEDGEDHASDAYNVLDFILLNDFHKFRSFLFPISVRPYVRERCLMFDNDIVDLYLRIPPHLRFNGRVYRKALAIINPQLLRIPYLKSGAPLSYPEPVEQLFHWFMPFFRGRGMQLQRLLGRYRDYPAAILDASYPHPDELLRHVMADVIREVLLDGKYLQLGLFDPGGVARVVDHHLQRRGNYGRLLTNLASFALWLEHEAGYP